MLKAPLMHESYRDLDQVIEKMNLYSKLAAQDMHSRGRRSSVPGAVAKGLWAFFRTYVLRAGILDGREGYMVAVATAQSTYYRYLKLMYLAEAARGGDARR
jgi:hypothetical protein